ncbi:MAG: ribosome biogenesis GTP-binding protein YihA/YsxC [Patescibacteria group bacterium]
MKATFLLSATTLEQLPDDERPHVALVGRSNVGKSSVLNRLTGQKGLAHESADPGRTRAVNIFDVDGQYYLVDLPGYGFAKASKAVRESLGDMIFEYLSGARQLKLVLIIVDARRDVNDLDREMIAYLETEHIPFALVLNKMDKLSQSETVLLQRSLAKDYPDIPTFPHSSVTGRGLIELRQGIDQALRPE